VIVEVPPVGDDVKATHYLESEIKEYASEKCAPSVSEQGLRAGRKRRVKHTISNDGVNLQPEQRQNNKKRRQREDDTAAQPANTERYNFLIIFFTISFLLVWVSLNF